MQLADSSLAMRGLSWRGPALQLLLSLVGSRLRHRFFRRESDQPTFCFQHRTLSQEWLQGPLPLCVPMSAWASPPLVLSVFSCKTRTSTWANACQSTKHERPEEFSVSGRFTMRSDSLQFLRSWMVEKCVWINSTHCFEHKGLVPTPSYTCSTAQKRQSTEWTL